ncbi:MAG: hypothetical protein OXC14_11255, partial [Rhodospirillaceae bacterium]|nr:hypothetical protein [Rhodospirillaceae bacterium]
MLKLTSVLCVVVLFPVLTIIGCGGGGGNTATTMEPPTTGPTDPDPPPGQPQPVERLPFPYAPSGQYAIDGLPRLSPADAQHMPIYRDRNRLLVGVDQGSQYVDTFTLSDVGSPGFSIGRIQRDLAAALPVVGTRGDVEVRHGRLSDGVGEDVVSAYLSEAVSGVVQRYSVPPRLRIIGPASADDMDRTIRAVQLVNAALPEEARVRVGAPQPGFSLRDRVTGTGSFQGPGEGRGNSIDVEFVPAGDYRRGSNSAAVTWGWPLGRYAYIQFNMGANSYPRDHEAITLLAHEIMHALGVDNHVSSNFASIMVGTGALHHAEQHGVREPLSHLYPVDREALRALYSRLDRGDDPTTFGPWDARTWRIDGNGPHANFGVALRNGYAEPWAYGVRPTTTLASNRGLSGSATWEGSLLGFTPSAEAVAGDAEIGVNLATMRGTADFTELESWAARAAPGAAGTGTQWLDGDLGYTIAVRGNTFRQTGGDAGRLTGIF